MRHPVYVVMFKSDFPEGDGGDAIFGIYTNEAVALNARKHILMARWNMQMGKPIPRYGATEIEVVKWKLNDLSWDPVAAGPPNFYEEIETDDNA